jgi:sugar phosphate isomerase/epimerase
MKEKMLPLPDRPDRPFRLATTSFIYPDHILPNVRKIGPFFDEIELLVFESQPGVLPSRADVRELDQLAQDLGLSYNIHLPTDISLTDPSGTQRAKAADTLLAVVELFAPLSPTTFTLHLPMDRGTVTREDLFAWDKRAKKGLELLVPRLPDPGLISLETLWYDPDTLYRLVKDYDLSLCIDAGHHFKYGHDLRATFERFKDNIPLVHLHGVDLSGPVPKGHTRLDRLPHELFRLTTKLLTAYEGTVSLEVFNLENLNHSLAQLSRVFKNIPILSVA